MHDVSGSAETQPDLPTCNLMAKAVEFRTESTEEAMARDEPSVESGVTSEEGSGGVEHFQGQKPEMTVSIGDVRRPEKVAHPVTPESPRVPNDECLVVTTSKTHSDTEAKTPGDTPKEISTKPAEDRPNRNRIVSLDRAGAYKKHTDGYSSPEAATTHSDDEQMRRERSSQGRRSTRARRFDDDGSSSDDDSSYFATHLPSPKSGRSFSYSSAGSAQAVAASFYQNNAARESDASLSFSDESDDDMHHNAGIRISPMIHPKGTVADMQLLPQRITRMHSVSSLVSSASSESGHEHQRPGSRRMSGGSVSSHTTNGTSSDPSVRAELQDVAAADSRPASHLTEASGRRSPVMGQHAGPGYFFSSHSPITSPPPILQGYVPPPGVSHPQPQPMSQDQMAAWVDAGATNPASQGYSGSFGMQGYGATMNPSALTSQGGGGFRNVSDQSHSTVPFVYSEDDETLEGKPANNMAAGVPSASGSLPIANTGNGGTSNGLPGPNSSELGAHLQGSRGAPQAAARVDSASDGGDGGAFKRSLAPQGKGFKVYWQRWLMLFYMSVLNLLSDWTCYSVAPISLLTEQAFGNIDPERLVVVFLGANAVASICEPIILSRLGLRRTVLFGSLLLMIGSVVKSGGVPPILKSDITVGHDEWRLYLGFLLVGLSQPLYQCTPTLLSSSWFPEEERTMATGVALNANQLGIGFAFVFGTLLVAKKDDIIPYFGLLSFLSTLVFIGTLIQFDDAPPTPPSSSARVVKGTFDVKLPSIDTIVQSVRNLRVSDVDLPKLAEDVAGAPSPADSHRVAAARPSESTVTHRDSKSRRGRKGSAARRRVPGSRSSTANRDSGLIAPSPALPGTTAGVIAKVEEMNTDAARAGVTAPSPVMPGRVSDPSEDPQGEGDRPSLYMDPMSPQDQQGLSHPPVGDNPSFPGQPGFQGGPPPPGMVPPYGSFPHPHPHYQYPYWDPRFPHEMQHHPAYYQQQYYFHQQQQMQAPPYMHHHPAAYPQHLQGYDYEQATFPAEAELDEGAEPILTITPHHLDIDIRDDQVIRSLRACFARAGFIHALVAFTASGIVINTLSTYMDYLVRLNGGPRSYTGIVGGTFQFVIMISSLIIGKFTDNSRAYYSVAIGMLVFGAFGLAECGVSLDSDRGNELRWCLVIVAVLVGPLQPVSTELGVDVVYPLSENTVLVIQQLFSNLLSALFIPIFKALKDVGSQPIDGEDELERPQYTFSFYLLIVIHTAATIFFATFNGQYLRYEHELQRKAEEEQRDAAERHEAITNAYHPFHRGQQDVDDSFENERQPLVQHTAV